MPSIVDWPGPYRFVEHVLGVCFVHRDERVGEHSTLPIARRRITPVVVSSVRRLFRKLVPARLVDTDTSLRRHPSSAASVIERGFDVVVVKSLSSHGCVRLLPMRPTRPRRVVGRKRLDAECDIRPPAFRVSMRFAVSLVTCTGSEAQPFERWSLVNSCLIRVRTGNLAGAPIDQVLALGGRFKSFTPLPLD